jgi:hypothetical protein
MVAVRSKGGRIEVDGSGTTMTKSLRKSTAATCSQGGVEAAACSGDGDKAAVCSRAGIMDGRWWWRCDNF